MKQELVQLAKDKGFHISLGEIHLPLGQGSSEREIMWMSLLQKWLREKNIIIDIYSFSIGTLDKIGYRFTWTATNWNLGDNINVCDESLIGLLTYEEAFEDSLFEALKLLKNE